MTRIGILVSAVLVSASACGGQITGTSDRIADDAGPGASSADAAGTDTDAGNAGETSTALPECDADVRADPLRACHVGDRCHYETPTCGYVATCIDSGWLTECVETCPLMSADPPAEGSACKSRGLACRFGPIPCDETDCTCTPSGGALVWECVTSHCR